ncbi:MAG: TIGR03560 family F420-dependent LLM class oxidoreductase [Acidimicrobiia bacterium]
MTVPAFSVVIPQGSKGELGGMAPEEVVGRLVRYGRLAEGLGFRGGWIYDHFLSWPFDVPEPVLEAWVTLATLAREVPGLRVGTMVTCVGYRNPALLAKMACSLDLLSGGRLDLGLGAGWYRREYLAYGYEYEPDGVRARRLLETTELLLQMWRGEPTTYRGTLVETSEALCLPRPVQRPHPPLWIGGSGEKTILRAAARHADAWNLSGPTVEEFRRKTRVLTEWCERFDRDPSRVVRSIELECLLTERPAHIGRLLEERASRLGKPEEEIAERHLVGLPEQIAERIEVYAGLGAEHFILWFPDAPDTETMEAFSESVMPLLQ